MNDRFVRTCRREPVDATPIWFMRQAGRSFAAYRALRERHGILELAKTEVAEKATMWKGQGCNLCSNTGYKGRIALYEVMPFTDPLKELVLQGASAAELKAEAIRVGMTTLRMSGINKVLEGMSTPDEVARVSASD